MRLQEKIMYSSYRYFNTMRSIMLSWWYLPNRSFSHTALSNSRLVSATLKRALILVVRSQIFFNACALLKPSPSNISQSSDPGRFRNYDLWIPLCLYQVVLPKLTIESGGRPIPRYSDTSFSAVLHLADRNRYTHASDDRISCLGLHSIPKSGWFRLSGRLLIAPVEVSTKFQPQPQSHVRGDIR